MNRSIILFWGLIFLLVVSLPVMSFAEDRTGSYIVIKPGAYFPTNNLHDKGFDNSFTGEIAVGTYYSPNLALEAGTGYFQTEATRNGLGFTEKDTIWAVPILITVKGVFPLSGAELYAGGGGGVYFTQVNAKKGSNDFGQF